MTDTSFGGNNADSNMRNSASLCASGTTNGTQRCSTWSLTWGNEVKATVSKWLDIDITENLDFTNGALDCVTAVRDILELSILYSYPFGSGKT